MATNTDIPIYTTTLTSNVGSVYIDLSSYQQYANLKIIVNGRDSRTEINDGFGLTFNSDTSTGSTSYSSIAMYAANSTTYKSKENNYRQISVHQVNAANGAANYFAPSIINIFNYSSSSMFKTVINKGGVTEEVYLSAGTWRNTEPITSITVWPGYNGSGYIFYAGTSSSVYGVGTKTITTKATGGIISENDNYIFHTFTSSGTFTPTQTIPNAEYLIVGGGGGGGNGYPQATGGGGGHVGYNSATFTAYTNYAVAVGAGGAAATAGSSSTFNSLTMSGGGGGASGYYPDRGGSSGNNINGVITNYLGGQTTGGIDNSRLAGGGGAGAGANGLNSSPWDRLSVGSIGGNGYASSITGSTAYYGGGGNGGNEGTGANGGWGAYKGYIPNYRSLGGGGWGGGQIASNPASKPTNGAQGLGGGGGGGTWDNSNPKDSGADIGAYGGSGIVIVRYAK